VPNRPGQRQGFFVDIYNPSDRTQTVLGFAENWPQRPGNTPGRIGVSSDPAGLFADPRSVRYRLPGAIPPDQFRVLREMWISSTCMSEGGSSGIDQLVLRVHIGWSTRTEVIPLRYGFYLSGTRRSHCPSA
jgi:hypothetical protein